MFETISRLAGCTGVLVLLATEAFAQKSADTLRLPLLEAQSTLDTYINPGGFMTAWESSIYENLLGFDPSSGKYMPLLAKSWSQLDDTTYELELQDNVTWHDGQKFSADDVVYTLNYLTDPGTRIRYKQTWSWIKSVEKLGPYKIKFTAEKPTPDALMWLSSGTPIYPRHVHEPLADKQTFGMRPIGTGPYNITNIDKNAGVVAEKYRNFVPTPTVPAASIARVAAVPMPDYGTQIASLLAGRIDMAVNLPLDEATALAETQRFDVVLAPPRVGYIFLQFPTAAWPKSKPLADPRVRRAIMMAIDRRAILKTIYGSLASQLEPLEGLCAKEQLGCDYGKMAPAYDPEQAKKLLAEAGYPDGFETSITCYHDRIDDATLISGMLHQIGIRMKVTAIHSSLRSKSVTGGAVEVGYFGWNGGAMFTAAPTVVRHFLTGDYQDPKLEKLAAPIFTLMDEGERRKAATTAFDYLNEMAYAFPMVPSRETLLMSRELRLNKSNDLMAAPISPHLYAWR